MDPFNNYDATLKSEETVVRNITREELPVLELRDVSVKRKRFRLHNINMCLLPGYIYAIAGENGSGKTTLLQSILSEKRKHTGRILFYGQDIGNNHAKIMNEIGFVSEDNIFFEERSARQNAAILGLLYDKFDQELFETCMKQMEAPMGVAYGRMSRGERIRFQVAFAAAHHSRLLLLDEATAGIDPVFRIEFFDMLRHLLVEGATVLMTSHNMTEIARQTDYVAFMKDGVLGEFKESLEVLTGV